MQKKMIAAVVLATLTVSAMQASQVAKTVAKNAKQGQKGFLVDLATSAESGLTTAETFAQQEATAIQQSGVIQRATSSVVSAYQSDAVTSIAKFTGLVAAGYITWQGIDAALMRIGWKKRPVKPHYVTADQVNNALTEIKAEIKAEIKEVKKS